MTIDELKRIYSDYFSLGYLNVLDDKSHTSFEKKLILISLICYLYDKNKPKNPDLTYYSLIYKISKDMNLPDDFLKGLSVVCEDFGYGCTKFPTFGIEGKQILEFIRNILDSYVPF